MSTTKERIVRYLDLKGIKKREFYKKINVSNGFLDSGKEITTDKMEIIMDTFPDLNIYWLVTGKGEMEVSDRVKNNIEKMSPKMSGNLSPKMSGNLDSTDTVPSDCSNGCPNCLKMEVKYFEAREYLLAKEGENKQLIAENAVLKHQNGQLRAELAECHKGLKKPA